MTPQTEHYLATVTIAMPFVLGGAHTLLTIARALDARSKTTASKADDAVTSRLLIAATWIDAIARAVAHAASLGFFLRGEPTPSPEHTEGEGQ